jgi:hypothetical protein
MLRTGWVVVRRMTRTAPSPSSTGEGGVGDQHGDGLVFVDAAEGDLLPGDHDHAGVAGPALNPDRLGGGAWWRPGGAGAAHHRLRSAGGQPVDRAPDRLVNPQVRQDRPPLPHVEIQAGPDTITAASPSPATCARPSTPSTPASLRTKN